LGYGINEVHEITLEKNGGDDADSREGNSRTRLFLIKAFKNEK